MDINELLRELEDSKTYKERSAKLTLEAFDTLKSNRYILITSGGVILGCHDVHDSQNAISNILILHDVICRTDSGTCIKCPELFVFVDQIAAFHAIDESLYSEIARQLSNE